MLLAWFDALERHGSALCYRMRISMAWFKESSVYYLFFSGIKSINSAKSAYGVSTAYKGGGDGLHQRDCRIYRDSGPLRGKEPGRVCCV